MFAIFERKCLLAINEIGNLTEFGECMCQKLKLKNPEQDIMSCSRVNLKV